MALRRLINIDADLADADWPKRTPDIFALPVALRHRPEEPKRHHPGGHDHDQTTHGSWAKGTATDLPDLPVNNGMEALSPEVRELILRYAKEGFGPEFPETPEEMAALLDALYGQATPEEIAAGLDWYDTASRSAREYADAYLGGDYELACAIIARTSPGREWESNIEVARRVMEVTSANKPYTIDAELYATIRDTAGMHGPGDYRPGDLTPDQLAWTHPQFKDRTLGKTYEHVPQIADAVRMVRRPDTIAEIVRGPKMRNFYNNIHDPEDPRWVTIDTWQVRASLPADAIITTGGGRPKATRQSSVVEKRAVDVTDFTGKPSKVVDKVPVHDTGMYPMFAEAVLIGAAEHGMLPNEYQAITWLVLRRIDR